MKQPQIKSNKQLYRIWFEFLKMAHNEPDLKENLKKTERFYLPWGDVYGATFDPWWKDHKHLFGQTYVQAVDRVVEAHNVVFVAIPLNQPSSRSITAVKEIIESRQRERLIELGVDPSKVKTLSAAFGEYSFTTGAEMRGRVLYDIQLMYRIWQDMGKPAVNSDFLEQVVDRLRSRPRSKWIPYLLQLSPQKDKKGNLRYDEGQIRQVRRYLKKGYEICRCVSLGEFPGQITL